MITNISEQLQRDEGLRLTAYADSRGYSTIGYGHRVFGPLSTITQAEANVLLTTDIASAERAITKELPWAMALPDVYKGVIINLTFNMGMDGLLEFRHFLSLMQAGRYSDAAYELLRSKWATEVGERAHRLFEQLQDGKWQ